MTNIKILFLVLIITAITAVFFACNQKKAQSTSDNNNPSDPPAIVDQKDDTQPTAKPYVTAGISRTGCFGKCPVYEVKFYTDNRATWKGERDVERLGLYEARLEEHTIKGIREKAREVGFFDFEYKYPVKYQIADLPTTITYIRIGDTEKTVKNTHGAPEKLIEFENYLDSLIRHLEWREVRE